MPRPRTLPYIVLGLLNKNGAMSGKDIMTEFDQEISEFWTVSHSQLYPELQRLLTAGQIAVVPTPAEADSKVVTYSITEPGRLTCETWLAEPITAKNDELTAIKLYVIREASNSALHRILAQELALHQANLRHLQARFAACFADQAAIDADYGHYLILTRAVNRETDYVHWLNQQT